MIPELGHFSLVLAMAFAICLSILPFIGVATQNNTLIASAKTLTAGMFVFTLISIVLLGVSFVQDDFSVKYVAGHSNSLLPFQKHLREVLTFHRPLRLFDNPKFHFQTILWAPKSQNQQ